MINDIGTAIAVVGTIISICGTLANNLWHKHKLAMIIWMPSNIILFIWGIGNFLGVWDGGLSGGALAIMYAVFSTTNFYGLVMKQW